MVENVIQINSGLMRTTDVSLKNILYLENGKYLANIIDDSFITCDEIILFHFEARTWHGDKIKSSTPYR